nr:hypothetical protein [Tanacetum cinerariifolium]
MLEKVMYDSWKTLIILYIRGKENGVMLKESIKNGPYKFNSKIIVKDTDGVIDTRRAQRLEDLARGDKLRYDSDIKAINILCLGPPVDIYTLINHYQTAKEIWDRVKELMEGTKMTKQARESMLYDEFDKFTSEPGGSVHSYCLMFTKLINNMRMIPMTMSPMQINTKFVNHLQPEWSRFVTAAKQAKDLYTMNFDQLYDFLKHNEKDAKESPPLQSYAPTTVQKPLTYQPNTELAIQIILPSDDPIKSLNKAIIFLSSVYLSKFPPTNNQLRTSSNPRTQATIQNGQVTVQNVQGRQSRGYAGNTRNNQALGARVINTVGNAGAN